MAGLPPPPAGTFGPHGHYAYGSYSAAPALRPFGGLATAAAILVGLMALVALFGVGAHVHRADLIDQSFSDGDVSFNELSDADDLVAVSVVVYGLGVLVVAAVFITWQHRHAVNAESLAGSSSGLGPGWAIGGWFIPCANWLLPAMQLFGASRASDPALPPRPAAGRGRGSALVVVWAAMFALGGGLVGLGSVNYPDEDEFSVVSDFEDYVSDATSADRMVAAGYVLLAAAAVLAAVMVRSLSRRQSDRAAAVAAAVMATAAATAAASGGTAGMAAGPGGSAAGWSTQPYPQPPGAYGAAVPPPPPPPPAPPTSPWGPPPP
jgi:Domain of unknown function (DUF4328)